MKHGSLFSGFGGFDLAAQWMGWENVFHCENNEFCQRILKYYWPKAKSYGDIKTTDFTEWFGKINIVSGGFPCQPFSLSGNQEGENDGRYQWPQMRRAIREIQPEWIIPENVYGLITKKFRHVFESICSQMEDEGYLILPVIIPASAVGGLHERYRVWLVAHSISNGHKSGEFGKSRCQAITSKKIRNQWEWIWDDVGRNGEQGYFTYSNGQGLPEWFQTRVGGVYETTGTQQGSEYARTFTEGDWSEFPTKSPIFTGIDGLPGKLDGITISKWRKESCKGAGNAIVPKIALQIFKTIEQFEELTKNHVANENPLD